MEKFSTSKTQKQQFRSPNTTPTLPPEIWGMIFQYITSKEDFLSVINTCVEWNELLAKNKPKSLFAAVLPSVIPHLDQKAILQCRLVSKSTKLSVDTTFKSLSMVADSRPFSAHYPDSLNQRHFRQIVRKLNGFYNFTSTYVQDFLQRVCADHPNFNSDFNPFLTGHIAYSCLFGVRHQMNQLNTIELLRRLGHHLSSVRIQVNEHSFNENQPNLLTHLSLLPNLKRLEIVTGSSSQTMHVPEEDTLPSPSYNFPELPNLIHISIAISLSNQTMIRFALAMLHKYGPQLTSFHCHRRLLDVQYLTVNVLNNVLSNVENFRLTGISCMWTNARKKLSNVSWGLEKLHLQTDYAAFTAKHPCVITHKNGLAVVNNFHQSLKELLLETIQLEVPPGTVGNKDKVPEEYKVMSKLKIINIIVCNIDGSLIKNFLQNKCQYVEQLHVEVNSVDDEAEQKGRWALEHLKNLEKVVFWGKRTTPEKTMRKSTT
ncbi:unnamed protein product [Orchesella dallaii]|uniref:F-box domain-containing protein n=1 Tax=Orchesella dallaii TaxID=48710 RepID=A0ABP1QCT5_9HEXA